MMTSISDKALPLRGQGVEVRATTRYKAEVARKKQQRMKSLGREAQTVVVDVIEEPAPGIITITEFEETRVPRQSLDGNRGRPRMLTIAL
jgi:hypothetical protein